MAPRGFWPRIRPIWHGRMTWAIAVIALALISLVVVMFGQQRASQTVTITARDAGGTIRLHSGQVLLISLPRTATGWSVWISDGSILGYKQEGMVAYSDDGKSQVISMPATANGTAILVVCPAKTCSPSQENALRFTVQVGP